MTSGSTRPMRTVESDIARLLRDGSVEVTEGCVVRQYLHTSGRAGSDGAQRVRVESVLDARVREANCQICSAFTGGHYLDTFEVLELHVPQPGEVLAVRHLTVHRDDQTVHRGIAHRRRFLPAGGILREQHVNGVRSDLDGAVSTRDFL